MTLRFKQIAGLTFGLALTKSASSLMTRTTWGKSSLRERSKRVDVLPWAQLGRLYTAHAHTWCMVL